MRSTVPLARRNILADRRRLVMSTLGVGLAVALILLLEGLWVGVRAGISAYPDRVGASLFVREPGTIVLTEGAVPLAAVATIRAIPGVQRADPVLAKYVILNLHDTKEPVSVIGFQPGALGGPWQITAGRTVRSAGEIVLDRSLAADHRVRVGDTLPVQGQTLRVVGLSSRTRTFIGGGFVFMPLVTAGRLFGESRTATFRHRPNLRSGDGGRGDPHAYRTRGRSAGLSCGRGAGRLRRQPGANLQPDDRDRVCRRHPDRRADCVLRDRGAAA